MSFNLWRPWIESTTGVATHPERYALRTGLDSYLAVAGSDEHIDAVIDPDMAWTFHTHERAVKTARAIASVFGNPVEVVKVL
jgi:hypothetical protein